MRFPTGCGFRSPEIWACLGASTAKILENLALFGADSAKILEIWALLGAKQHNSPGNQAFLRAHSTEILEMRIFSCRHHHIILETTKHVHEIQVERPFYPMMHMPSVFTQDALTGKDLWWHAGRAQKTRILKKHANFSRFTPPGISSTRRPQETAESHRSS